MRAQFSRPRQLGLITTHQCTAACDHCCFSCTPRVTKRIPSARLAALIDEARDVPSIKSIGFSGGECFLLGKELDSLIARASGYGYHTTCTTNGYWAVNQKAARERIARCAAAGLDDLNLSTGQMHARFVPAERVVYAAAAALDAGLDKVYISIEVFENSTFDVDAIVEHPEIQSRKCRRLEIFLRPWIPNAEGNGVAVLRDSRRHGRFRKDQITGCDSLLDTVTVTPDLRLKACCGYHIESIAELRLASIEHQTLAQALAEADEDVLKFWIHVAGPERMLMFVKKYVPGYELPRHYTDICQTCLHMHRDTVAMRVLREHADEVATEVTAQYLASRDAVCR